MNTKSIIEIFRGDDSDALGYQTIVGTIHTDLDLTGCKAVFRYLGFFQEFDPIPEDGKLTIVIPAASSIQFPPGLGYASLKVYDIDRKVRTFTNRIPVFVSTKTPCRCGGEFDIKFSPFPELEPLKIFIGPNADDYDLYTGFVMKIIDRASAEKYGLSMIYDDMDSDMGANSGVAASPVAVKAAYDAILGMLADNYYNKEQTDEQIDKLAAYYITADAQGNPFATHAALVNATTYYSGGDVRVPTRNDYAIVKTDETHNNEEWRYIYSENAQGVGQWEPQYAVEGVIAFDDYVTKASGNGVKSSGIWSALWGALAALPTDFTSLYDWCVAQLAGKASKSDVDPLLFAQYYPDGSVKSAAEFTQGIKYDDPDTTNRTITVKPFCNIDGTAENDNSGLEGRVVIPPFVDASGNPYISDDGTRFKVVGVSGQEPYTFNNNLTDIVAPNTVTTIEDSVFPLCTSLVTVSLPAATTIGVGAFVSCTALTSISLHAAENIVAGAFSGCTSLDSVDFGDTPRSSVPALGEDAFYNVPTSCKIIVPYTQYDEWKAARGWSSLRQEFVRHAEKADKPATFTEGNLAKFDSNGNPTDSGKKPSDKLDSTSAAPAWVSGTAYAVNALVTYNGLVYRCKADTVSLHTATPDADTTHWEAKPVSELFLPLAGGAMTGQLQVFNLLSAIRNVDTAGAVSGARFILRGTTNEHYIQFAYQDDKYGLFVKNGPFDAGTFYPMDNIAAVPNKADISAIPYTIGTPTVIDEASTETVEGETVNYGEATLANRTANIVQVTAATALDELRITFPAATSGKVRDFGLRVEIGTGSAALTAPALVPIAPTGETIKIENADGTIPELADGTATAKGVTLLYFSETAPGVFVVKGEQVEEVA